MARRHAAIDSITRQPRRAYGKRQARGKPVAACAVLLALFAAVSAVLIWRVAEYSAARHEYVEVQAVFEGTDTATPTPPEPAGVPAAAAMPVPTQIPVVIPTATPFYSAKVEDLRKSNRDAVGWLDISGTDMQYPLVQGTDNTYYMEHTFLKKRNASGAIFVDCWNAPDFTDFNTVIYGHNMKDGSMFSGLREYRHQSFFDEHPYVEVMLTNKKLCYRVFAAYTSQGEDSAEFRGQDCATELDRSAFIKAARKRSTDIASGYTVSRYDRLLTLVTCTGGDHPWFWVVHAVLVEEEL